jgi:hypothetical protein
LTDYWAMLAEISSSYGDKNIPIINICGAGTPNTPSTAPCPAVKKASDEAGDNVPAIAKNKNSYYVEFPANLINSGDFGCIAHKNVKGQTKVAEYLAPKINEIMGWDSSFTEEDSEEDSD